MNYQYSDFEPQFTETRSAPSRSNRRGRRRSLWTRILFLAVLVGAIVGVVAYLDIAAPTGTQVAKQAVALGPSLTPAAPQPTAAPALKGQSSVPSIRKVADMQDWALFCPSAPAAEKCFAQQRLASSGDQTAFLWTIYVDGQGTVRAVWQTPADVDTKAGMAFDLGDGQTRTVPFEACDARSCTVRAILTPAYLDQLKQATQVAALVTAASSNQVVRYNLSARGLAEALARL